MRRNRRWPGKPSLGVPRGWNCTRMRQRNRLRELAGLSALVIVLLLLTPVVAHARKPTRCTTNCHITAVVKPIVQWGNAGPEHLKLSPDSSENGTLTGAASFVLLTNVDTKIQISGLSDRPRRNSIGRERPVEVKLEYDGDGINATGVTTSGRAGPDASPGLSPQLLHHVPGDGMVRVRLFVRVGRREGPADHQDGNYHKELKLVASPGQHTDRPPSELTVVLSSRTEESQQEFAQTRRKRGAVVAWAGPIAKGGKSIGYVDSLIRRPVLVEKEEFDVFGQVIPRVLGASNVLYHSALNESLLVASRTD